MRARIGVYGGAFDPPHRAHGAVAQTACEALDLDELRIVPTGVAWHKARVLSPAEHRVAMARLAFAHLDKVRVDEIEARQAQPSFTFNTLSAFKAQAPNAAFFLIMGRDQWVRFETWHRWQAIADMAQLVVVNRPTETAPTPERLQGLTIQTLNMAPDALSATQLRAALHSQPARECVGLLDAQVARYIDQHSLYR